MVQSDDEFEYNTGNEDYEDDGTTKKKILAGILILACLFSGLLFFQRPAPLESGLTSLDQVDSLITRELSFFNIPPNRIRTSAIMAGDSFERKTFRIEPPSGFAKSFFHIELARKLRPLGIEIFGTIEFPDRNHKLVLLYDNTVIRTIHLLPPAGYELPGYPATLMLVFDARPEKSFANRIIRELSTVALVFRVNSAEDAVAWTSPFGNRAIFFWMDAGSEELPSLARSLRSVSNRPRFVLMDASQKNLREQILQSAGRNAGWVDGTESIIITDRAGRLKFEQDLGRYLREARAGNRPIALVQVSALGLDWLADSLHDYRKGGMVLTSPTVALQ